MPPPPTALVTGASRGIGRAIARQLAARGCRVAVHFQKNRPAVESVLASLPGTGHVALAADLAQPAAVERLWREATSALGPIAILVNNAGIYDHHPILATDHAAWCEIWQRTLATNLFGPAQLCHLAAQAMAGTDRRRDADDLAAFDPAHGRGRIVNISSRGAFRGEPDAPAYAAGKAGLNALSQSLAQALAPQAIYVFCVAPGWVATDMAAEHLAGPGGAEILAQHPLGRVASPEEIARAAAFCALDAPAAMTGGIIDVNGASYLRS